MAIQYDLLKNYLDQMGVTYTTGEAGQIQTAFEHKGNPIGMQINLHEDGELFQLETIAIPPGELAGKENLEQLFVNLLHFSWVTPFGAPEMDKDGEIRFRVEIPLEDGTLTFKQFIRIFGASLDSTVIIRSLAKKIIAGEELESSGEVDSNLMQMAMLAMMKARVILADSDSSEEAKAEARKVIEHAKQDLPEEILKVLLREDEIRV